MRTLVGLNHAPKKMAVKNTQQQSLAEGVDKELTCAICLCRYDHPKILPCLHSYCKRCLEKLVKKVHPQQQITCPQCKEVHQVPPQGIDVFKTYFTINNLVELLRVHEATTPKESTKSATVMIACESGVDENPAMAHCLTCSDHLCESCFQLHKKQKLSRDHNVVMLKDLQQMDRKTGVKSVRRKLHCDEHKDELLKLFCKTCEKVICRDCALVNHREHKYVFVHEFRNEAQKQLQVLVKKTKEKQAKFRAHSDYLAKVRESSLATFVACKRELNTVFDQMIMSIEDRRKTLLKELETLGQTEEKMLNAETDYLELGLARFSNSIQFTENLIDNENDVEMMLMSTQAKPALESLQQLTWDQKKALVKPLRMSFDQKDIMKCKSVGSIMHSLKDSDVVVSGVPAQAQKSFSFEISMAKEASKLGIDFTPVLSVQVTHSDNLDQVEEPVEIKRKDMNTWKITCESNEIGQHKITVKLDTVVKVYHVQIDPKPLVVGMKVVRGRDWNAGNYGEEDGGEGIVGEVVDILSNSRVNVKWPNGNKFDYRWGKDSKYDLKIV